MRQWRRATVATPGEWQCKTGGVRRLAVANGPNIFQMLLVTIIDETGLVCMLVTFDIFAGPVVDVWPAVKLLLNCYTVAVLQTLIPP